MLWAEKDNGTTEELKPKPTICWESSAGHYQAIWMLSSPISPDKVEETNKYLATHTGSDKSGWDLTQLLRVPGSINYKYNPPQTGRLLWDDGPIYRPEDIVPVKSEIEKMVEEGLRDSEEYKLPESLPSYQEVLQAFGSRIPSTVWSILNSTPDNLEDWSEKLWKLERLLIEAKLPLEAVFVIARDCPYNKYARDGRPDIQLWQEIVRAAKSHDEIESDTTGMKWMGLTGLMGYHERPKWLVEDIWMEKNVGWIAGDGKSYKSTLSIDLALSIASGKPFLGKYKIVNPGPVLMIQEEDPLWRVARRAQVISVGKNISRVNVTADDETLSMEVPPTINVPLYVACSNGFNFADSNKLAMLEEAMELRKPRMVILDPWFMMTPGLDEFKSGEITPVLAKIKYWRDKYECAFAVVHHNRKSSGESRTRLYGSMALYAWSENSLFVSRQRGTNMTIIERDIKDALTDEVIGVEFRDIENAYLFNVFHGNVPGYRAGQNRNESEETYLPPAEKTVASYLNNYKVGTTVSRKELIKVTKYSDNTISQVIENLHKRGYIDIAYKGRGGQLMVTTTERLKHMEEEGIDLS